MNKSAYFESCQNHYEALQALAVFVIKASIEADRLKLPAADLRAASELLQHQADYLLTNEKAVPGNSLFIFALSSGEPLGVAGLTRKEEREESENLARERRQALMEGRVGEVVMVDRMREEAKRPTSAESAEDEEWSE